jgi:hypothetical protein
MVDKIVDSDKKYHICYHAVYNKPKKVWVNYYRIQSYDLKVEIITKPDGIIINDVPFYMIDPFPISDYLKLIRNEVNVLKISSANVIPALELLN